MSRKVRVYAIPCEWVHYVGERAHRASERVHHEGEWVHYEDEPWADELVHRAGERVHYANEQDGHGGARPQSGCCGVRRGSPRGRGRIHSNLLHAIIKLPICKVYIVSTVSCF